MYQDPTLIPPLNFAMVVPGIYRSGFPNKKNFGFLEKLGIKTIVCLYTDKDYPEDHMEFVQNHNISLKPFDMEENKEPFNGINEENFHKALREVQCTMFSMPPLVYSLHHCLQLVRSHC